MVHTKAFAIKFIANFVLLYIVLGLFYDVSLSNLFVITLILGVASYSLGDMAILNRTNNITATISDFVLAFLVIWFFGNHLWLLGDNLRYGYNFITGAFTSAVAIAIFEFFFHMYVAKYRDYKVRQIAYLRYQTEVAEEISPSELKNLSPSELSNRNKKVID